MPKKKRPYGKERPPRGTQGTKPAVEKELAEALGGLTTTETKKSTGWATSPREHEAIIQSSKLAPKPKNPGTLGERSRLYTNHYQIQLRFQRELKVYQFDVAIKKVVRKIKGKVAEEIDLTIRDDCDAVFWAFVDSNKDFFVDQRTLLYDRNKIAFSLKNFFEGRDAYEETFEMESSVTRRDKERRENTKYTMKIAPAANGYVRIGDEAFKVAYKDNPFDRNMAQKQILDLLFRKTLMNNAAFEPCGRLFYMTGQREKLDLGCGRQLWKGFYRSPTFVDGWRLTLNVDITANAFYEPKQLTEFAKEILRLAAVPRTLDQRQISQLKKELKGLKLKATHLGYTFAFVDILGGANNTAATKTFRWVQPNGQARTVTIQQYFREQYKKNLTFPNLPVLQKGKGQTASFYPFELCRIADKQRVPNSRLTQQQPQIIRETALPPDVRMRKITEGSRQFNLERNESLSGYMLSMNMNLLQVDGRALPPPRVQYASGEVQPNWGSWNMERKQVYKPSQALKNWAVLICDSGYRRGGDDRYDVVFEFVNALVSHARGMGMQMSMPFNIQEEFLVSAERLEMAFQELCERKTMELIMCFLPRRDEQYGMVKLLGDTKFNVATQCIQMNNAQKVATNPRRQASTLSNICLKLNAKVNPGNSGGINSTLACQEPEVVDGRRSEFAKALLHSPVLFIGADVTHPDPGDKESPSIAGIAGSIDNHPARYVGIEQVQEHRMEMIVDLKQAVKQMLLEYTRNTRLKPVRIIQGCFATRAIFREICRNSGNSRKM